jgi:hypothetical protein
VSAGAGNVDPAALWLRTRRPGGLRAWRASEVLEVAFVIPVMTEGVISSSHRDTVWARLSSSGMSSCWAHQWQNANSRSRGRRRFAGGLCAFPRHLAVDQALRVKPAWSLRSAALVAGSPAWLRLDPARLALMQVIVMVLDS